MPTRTIFYDANENKLECYLNTNGDVFLQVGEINTEDIHFKGVIVLNKEDVKQLIQVLTELEKEMTN